MQNDYKNQLNNEVNIKEFYTNDAMNLIRETVSTIKKKNKRIVTPKDLALEIIQNLLKRHVDKTLDIVNAMERIEKTSEVENLSMYTQRYIFYSPELQVTLINAFIESQKDGMTDVGVEHITKALTKSIPYTDVAKILKEVLDLIENKLQDKIELKDLESEMQKRIIGQTEAIDAVVTSIKRSTTILKNPNKPIGSFLFLGPTGVGKTELAKTLASLYFNDEKAFIRLDMSEYSEPHTTQKLIGAPPGYVGYEQGGQLTNIVNRKPDSLILFDEIEKANEKVFDLFLQIIDDARLTDSQGGLVSFKNTILIFTSNVGSQIILSAADDQNSDLYKNPENFYKENILPLLLQTFKPEFINRFEDIIMFQPLTKDQLAKIAQLKIHKIAASLMQNEIRLVVKPETFTRIINEGYDPKFGARPMERAIQKIITDPIAELLTENKIKNKTTFEI